MVEEDGVGSDYPFSGEKLSPVLTVYRVKNFNEAKELANQTTNNVFIGSTSDLQRMLLDDNEDDKVVDITDYKKDE